MDLSFIKPKDTEQGTGNTSGSSSATQMSTMAATFNELMRKAGSMMSATGNSQSERAEMATSPQNYDEPIARDDAGYDNRDSAPRGDDEAVVRTDDSNRDYDPERSDSNLKNAPDTDAGDHDRSRQSDDGRDNDSREESSQAGDDPSDGNEERSADNGNSESSDQDGDAGMDKTAMNDGASNAQGDQAQSQTASGQAAAGLDVNAMVTNAQVSATPQQTGPAEQVGNQQNGPAVESVAINATTRTEGNSGNTGQNGTQAGQHGQNAQARAAANAAQAPVQSNNLPQATTDNAASNTNTQPVQQTIAAAEPLRSGAEATIAGETSAAADRAAKGNAGTATADANRAGQHGQQGAQGSVANAQAVQQNTQQAAQAAAAQQANTASQNAAASSDARAAIQGIQSTSGTQHAAGGAETNPAGNIAPTSETAQTQRSAAAHAAQTPRFVPQAPAMIDQISVQISKAISEGMDRINIQLSPPELGRIAVQLDVGSDGRVSAVITADNRATLELLQRDSRGLEQALADAGLDLQSGDLSYNLREQADGNGTGDPDKGNGEPEIVEQAAAEPTLEELLNPPSFQGISPDGRVNILT